MSFFFVFEKELPSNTGFGIQEAVLPIEQVFASKVVFTASECDVRVLVIFTLENLDETFDGTQRFS